MESLKMSEYRAILVPQERIRCNHCAEKGQSEGKDHLSKEFYTTQIPVAVVLSFSDEVIKFKDIPFQYVVPMIETKCSVCGGVNLYPLVFWSERSIEDREERRKEEVKANEG